MKLYFTGTQKEGDRQTEPRLSVGHYISGSEISNAVINNLFGEISQYTLEKQVTEYRAIALKNTTNAIVTQAKLFYDNISNNPLTNIRMAIVLLAQDSCGWYMERIMNIDAKPINAIFVDNRGIDNAIDLPSINMDEYIGIWIERSFNTTAVQNELSCETLITAFQTTPTEQISTIETIADIAGSLENTYWLLDTPKNKFYIYYSLGSGMMPSVPNREPIKILIASGDSDIDIATKTTTQLNNILTPRGELTAISVGNLITITNILPGEVPVPKDISSSFIMNTITVGAYGGMEKVEDIALTISW